MKTRYHNPNTRKTADTKKDALKIEVVNLKSKVPHKKKTHEGEE